TVQQQLIRRRTVAVVTKPFGRAPYPLSGITYCGDCGLRLIGSGAQRKYRYMRCGSTDKLGKGACSQPMVRSELLEAQLASYLGGMRLPDEYIEEVLSDIRRTETGDS